MKIKKIFVSSLALASITSLAACNAKGLTTSTKVNTSSDVSTLVSTEVSSSTNNDDDKKHINPVDDITTTSSSDVNISYDTTTTSSSVPTTISTNTKEDTTTSLISTTSDNTSTTNDIVSTTTEVNVETNTTTIDETSTTSVNDTTTSIIDTTTSPDVISTADEPTTTVNEPTTTVNEPTTTVNEPTTTVGDVTTTDDTTTTTDDSETTTKPTVTIVNSENSVSIIDAKGDQESLYATFLPVTNATSYNTYVKAQTATKYTKLAQELTRLYKDDNNNYYYRVDAVGIEASTYEIKIVPVINDKEDESKAATATNIDVISYDRTGFAFSSDSTYGSGSGAYNDNGTLKSGAQVIYVNAANAKTVTATVNGSQVSGLQSILDAKQKATSSSDILDIRIIGEIKLSDLDHISSSSEGLQIKGANKYQNMNITFEGVGSDACVNGFGFLLRNCGNLEIRNIGILNFMDDGISMDTANANLWIHDNDIFYGSAGSDKDQAKGDGSTDLKGDSQYITISYNHYYDSGKCVLCGMKSESGPNYISFHHNWFDHSDSRHPRIRTMSAHIYNNYYDGNSKYGIGMTYGGSAFSENNIFRNCNHPYLISMQGTDALGDGTFSGENGGVIKCYNDSITGGQSVIYASETNTNDFDAYKATTRDEVVSSTYVAKQGGTSYNNFDTKVDLGVTLDQITPVDQVVYVVEQYAGRMNGGDIDFEFNDSVDDSSYAINSTLKSLVTNYTNIYLVESLGATNSSSSSTTPEQGTTDPETPSDTTVTASDVIALIDALPEASNVTASSKANINAAKTAYVSLADDEKAKVTNYSKLVECINALANLTSTGSVSFANGTTTVTGDIEFAVSGSYVENSATIDGTSYSHALKMDSKGSITFTLDSDATITIYAYGKKAGNTLYLNDTVISTSADVTSYTYKLSSGTYTISKKSGETYIYLVTIE